MTKTAKIYGDSLYDLAAEEKLTEEILPQMEQVAVLFKENPDYLTLLSEPSIPKTERVGLLDKAFEGQLSLYLLNFLKLLCESGMLREYRDSCRQFKARYNEDHNIAEAVVTTAVALTEAQAQALKERLEKISGKTVLLTQKTDSTVLGGIRVELEGKQLDGTVQERLSSLEEKKLRKSSYKGCEWNAIKTGRDIQSHPKPDQILPECY